MYFSLFSKGNITFPAINFIGAQPYASLNSNALTIINDRIVIPITAVNSGSKAKAVRLKAVINKGSTFHNTLCFKYIKLPTPIGTMTLDNFQTISPAFVILPKSSTTKILGFTQKPMISEVKGDLIIDVWYQIDAEVEQWKKAFRIVWNQWPKLVQSYSLGNFVSSINFEFTESFNHEYKSDILKEK
jgi:hypothetical protein